MNLNINKVKIKGALETPCRCRLERLGSVLLGSARFGSARLGSVRLSSVRLGSAQLGSARLGSALLQQQEEERGPLVDGCKPVFVNAWLHRHRPQISAFKASIHTIIKREKVPT